MKKANSTQLPDAELDIMMILWEAGEPLAIPDIHKKLQTKRTCTKPAVYILVDRLAEKGFVRVETVDSPVQYKLAIPLINEREYCAAASDSFISKLFRGSWQRLIANLVDTGKISSEDIDEISAIINKKE